MNMKEYILNDIDVLKLNSSIKRAQEICNAHSLTHVPIVENNKLIGCISESDFETIDDSTSSVSEYSHLLTNFFTNERETLLENIKIFADNETNIVPVLNQEKNYLGYYELNDLLDLVCSTPFIYNEGVTLVVEKVRKNFSMSEICQIIESNQCKLLGLYISAEISDTTQVTIKISSEDVNEVIQTFRRYNYSVISQHKDDFYLQDLKYKSEYLQKYLDM